MAGARSSRFDAQADLFDEFAGFEPEAPRQAAQVQSPAAMPAERALVPAEAASDRAAEIPAEAPLVLCPSHKSHVDYLVMSWVLWNRGYAVPLVAAGANLSFWPLGPLLRRCGAFFLRRSFKDDKVYAASFNAYVKKLVHDGVHK